MPNTYFQFKQFRIDQGSTAMKVTTEACILGAWVDESLAPLHILDIGTGTGLLALMLAQKFPQAQIDAVEMEGAAYRQAKQNFSQSPWKERLYLVNQPIQQFNSDAQYDLVITNPPFFNRSLLSPEAAINRARHDASLPQVELIAAIKRLLSGTGTAYVLYPPMEARLFAELAGEHRLFPSKKLIVYNTPDRKKALRYIMQYGFAESTLEEDELVIRQLDGGYTEQFVELLRNYYLHL